MILNKGDIQDVIKKKHNGDSFRDVITGPKHMLMQNIAVIITLTTFSIQAAYTRFALLPPNFYLRVACSCKGLLTY